MIIKLIKLYISLATLIFLSACGSTSQTNVADVAPEQVSKSANEAEPAIGSSNGPPRGGMGMGPGPSAGVQVQVPVPDINPSALEVYKTVNWVELKAHIFNPQDHSSSDSRPVMLFLHGGALRFGDPTEGYGLAEYFNPKGVVVISAEYRLIGTNAGTIDQLVADTKSLTRWARENADRLGINPEKILFSGHGTGAYLAMLGVLLDGHNEPSDNLTISAMPDSVIFWSLVTTRRNNSQNSILPEGYTMVDFSAPKNVPNNLPPALFIHGELDPAVSPALALEFHDTYSQAGNQSSYHSIKGADHVFADPGHRGQVFSLINDFLINLGYIPAG